jgi:deoxyribonuclease-4
MAGKGSEVGRNFEELAQIIELVEKQHKIGICFDTCHTHDSGYDIIDAFDDTIGLFDKILGLDRLKVFHINGSLNPRGAKKDRHANLGAGEDNPRGHDYIGKDALYYIVHHEAAKDRPIILETPWLDSNTNLYKEEITFLRGGSYE